MPAEQSTGPPLSAALCADLDERRVLPGRIRESHFSTRPAWFLHAGQGSRRIVRHRATRIVARRSAILRGATQAILDRITRADWQRASNTDTIAEYRHH